MYKPNRDGIDHINIYSNALSQMGRDLSNFAHTPFVHPTLGRFASVEGLWYWLSRQDERLRDMSGFEAKRLGRSLEVVRDYPSHVFRRLIADALTAKLQQHPEIFQALVKTTLPLTHYYVKPFSGVDTAIKAKDSEWLIAHFEDLRYDANPLADRSNRLTIDADLRRRQTEAQMQPSLF